MNASTLLAAIFAVIAATAIAFAHSDGDQHYDPWCCNNKDCAPIPASAVTAGPDGWRVTIRPGDHPLARNSVSHFIPYGQERRATDGRHHACLFPSEQSLRCLYTPPMGF